MANTKNSIYLSDDLQAYLDKQCEAYGMGKSAYVSMVLTFYRQQTDAMNEMQKLDSYLKRIEGLLKKESENNELLTEREIKHFKKVECSACEGKGFHKSGEGQTIECPVCGGTGLMFEK